MGNSKLIGNCALCDQSEDISGSHIIPSQVLKHLKRESILDHPTYVNERGESGRQKLKVEPLLCDECESRFNRLGETKFAKKVLHKFAFEAFYPGESVNVRVQHESWLQYFSVSVVWRVLAYMYRYLDSEWIHVQIEAEELWASYKTWRDYLLGGSGGLSGRDQYMVPLGKVKPKVDSGQATDYINQYLCMGVNWGTAQLAGGTFVYAKLPCFVFLGQVRPRSVPEISQYRVDCKGELMLDNNFRHHAPKFLVSFLRKRTAESRETAGSPSESKTAEIKETAEEYMSAGKREELKRFPETAAAYHDSPKSWEVE